MAALAITLQEKINSTFHQQKAKAIEWRQSTFMQREDRLIRMRDWINSHQDEICQAIFEDFRKPKEEVLLTEILVVLQDINHTVSSLKDWMGQHEVKTPVSLLGTRSYIHYEPKGVALIIAPWNYPFNLMMGPLVSALAAGCTAILKPSELTPHTAALISKAINELYTPNEVVVFEGEAEVSQYLLSLPFDHVFFTGSPAIGKHVMRAAADHLASVTLELGGKSPAIVDRNSDIRDAAQKIVWGKFVNNGQTCIAPDYVLIDELQGEAFLQEMIAAIVAAYGKQEDIQKSKDLARIVNARHYQRLKGLLDDAIEKGAKIAFGGDCDENDYYISPTLVLGITEEMEIAHEEIFGPLLPVITYKTKEQAADYINTKPKPLSLYIFSNSQVFEDYFITHTSSGGVCVNDAVIHFMNSNLPFGGVNNSGIGKAHGHFGFIAFSNEKSVLRQRVGFTGVKLLYPPYSNIKRKTIEVFKKLFG